MTTPTPTTATVANIFIPAGTIVGYCFRKPGREPISGTVSLLADCYIDGATREEDGSWSYGINGDSGRTYYCAGGLATVLR